MTLGNKVSPLFVGGVGPPNQPAKKPGHAVEYPSGWRGRDLYGNEWECTYNARPEGKSPGNKWRATKMPIVLPVTASDINTGTFYVWYPQEEFILTNVMFVNNGYLQCADDTKLSFGTSDNTTVWLSGNNTQINDATTVPWQAKYSSSKLIDKAWRMLSMWSDNDHIGKEDFGANKKYNYIRGYRTGGECAEGSGATIIIEGIYPQHLWNGF
jgi:hypothetical protein